MELHEGLRLYISGALLGASDLAIARKKYEIVAELLAQKGLESYLPHQQTDPILAKEMDAIQVFSTDLKILSECDAVLAFLDEPSLGVGAEVALAIHQDKSVFAACRRGIATSRFLEGLLAYSPNCTLFRYDTLDHCCPRTPGGFRENGLRGVFGRAERYFHG